MNNWTWEDLKKYWVGAEQWVEGEASHLAVLWARAMNDERMTANAAAPVVDSPPVVDPVTTAGV
jgi:hypothetical protein